MSPARYSSDVGVRWGDILVRDGLLLLGESGRFNTPLGVTPSGVDGMKVDAKAYCCTGARQLMCRLPLERALKRNKPKLVDDKTNAC